MCGDTIGDMVKNGRPNMKLLVIGGLRDYDRSMRFLLSHWQWRGFKVHYFPFGWEDPTTRMESRLAELRALIDKLPPGEKISLMGISAGGAVVTLLLLDRPGRIHRVATISSPINYFKPTVNKVLNEGLALLKKRYTTANAGLLARIGSFRGQADAIVWPSSSTLPGAHNQELPARGHFVTIILALTVYSGRVAAWLNQK